MRHRNRFWAPLLLAGLLPQPGPAQNAAETHTPVLVELFTSQGCSSCPPAEGLLNGWGLDQFQKGKIIPLAFHVDYWDYLGWKDPFSQRSFTERQRAYARALGSDSLYTPQMVIDGKVGFVGSNASRAKTELAQAHPVGPATVPDFKAFKGEDGLHLKIGSALAPKNGAKWFLAVFENGLSTKVSRGENAGSLLQENFVVRDLRELGPAAKGQDILLPWGKEWKAGQCGVVVFVQDPWTMAIQGARCLYPLVGR